MPRSSSLPIFICFTFATALSACGATKAGTTDGGETPACVAKVGQYPPGPFGTMPGSVIANIEMSGRRDGNASGGISDDMLATIKLGDYARPDVKILALIVGAEWCGPCKAEQPELVQMW